jgi:hypothetical protein
MTQTACVTGCAHSARAQKQYLATALLQYYLALLCIINGEVGGHRSMQLGVPGGDTTSPGRAV